MIQDSCSLRSSKGRLILLATILASGSTFIIGNVIPIAIPRIQSEFNTTLSGIQWVVNGYLLALSALIIIGGGLGDRYGRKRVFVAGTVLFSAAACFSGFSPSISVLVPLQVLQGIGAALMLPQSLAIINDCFPEEERGRVIGLWAGLSGGIAAAGPLAGGWLVDRFSWPAVFFLIALFSLVSLVITLPFVPRTKNTTNGRLDWQGGAFILLGLFGLAYGLISGSGRGWTSPVVLISFIGSVTAIAAFIFYEKRQAQPLVQLGIFKNRLVAGANAVTLFLYFGVNGVLFFVILDLQQALGYSPTAAGLAMLPPIVLVTVLTGPAGALTDRIGPRLQMILGPAIAATGMVLLSTAGPDATYIRNFLPGLSLFGIGMALTIPPLTRCALSVPPAFSGSASGVNNGMSRVSGLLAVAILGVVMLAVFNARLAEDLNHSDLTAEQRQQIVEQSDRLGGITIPPAFDAASRQEAATAIKDSFVYAFQRAMAVCAGLAVASTLISFFTIRNPGRQGQNPPLLRA